MNGGITNINAAELELIKALRAIVFETMDYPPCSPWSGDSYLPPQLVANAQQALALYGARVVEVHHEAVRAEIAQAVAA